MKTKSENDEPSSTNTIDPLDAFVGNGKESMDEPFEEMEDDVLPENTIFDCSDDAPEYLLAYRGVEVGNLPENIIRELARKNAKARVTIDKVALAAIDLVKQKL